MRYTYILKCSDGTYYTGVTNDLDKRLYDHNNTKLGAKYTKSRRPVTVIWNRKAKDKPTAMKREWKIKTMTKVQKTEIIQGKRKTI